ncbi:MAG: MmcQ/YjbR family DNA-binding protein, partial [Candidatus Aegiribacteria sp.]|nr:MmcQ/YjbR family DNA-binding protein [Candidatus Aegiribacteria sp.]
MSYEWLDEYCLGKVNAVKDYKMEWEAFRYLIGGKMFAMQGEDKEKNSIISLKCDPLYGESLRKEYQHIAPGYYLNKEHWNSVNLDGDVP